MTEKETKVVCKRFAEMWAARGDEKQETQVFWLSLLRDVFGVTEPEKIIQFEKRAKLDSMGFIDAYLPTTAVLIEQKSSDVDLRKTQSSGLTPYQQARQYAAALPFSERPRYIVTCNFREILVYDQENPTAEPESILLKDLPKEYYRLAFLVDSQNVHIRRELEISIKAGEIVGRLYDALLKQYANPNDKATLHSLNVLCVRLVFCLYAEDAGVFGGHQVFGDYISEFDAKYVRRAILDLFKILNTKPEDRDPYLKDENPRLAAFPYVNGGLFARDDIEVPPFTDEIKDLLLNKASEDFDWSQISPTIFGAVFESTLNPETRRKGGMHYTSIENIHKVIDPLFLDDLKAEFEKIRNLSVATTKNKRLREFQLKLGKLKFLDPACGSGNFLTETYISLRRLENDALREMEHGQALLDLADANPIEVKISQFSGIEINDFAVTVAKTALWIAENQMMKETETIINIALDFLPLKTNATIVEGNALRIDWKSILVGSEKWVVGSENLKIGDNKYDNELQRIDCVAESNRNGARDLSISETTSQRRSVCSFGSNETSGDFDSFEHSRGTGAFVDKGVSSVLGDCKRFECGIGDAANPMSKDRIFKSAADGKSNELVVRNQKDVECVEEKTTLTTNHSSLSTNYDYIIGNPPFVGYSLQSSEQKADILSLYVDEKGKPYKTAGKIDYVAGWYWKAAQLMQGTSTRAALVSTNSITQGEQVAAVWKSLMERFGLTIDFAHRTFRWDSEASAKAHVHCVIVGFSCLGGGEVFRRETEAQRDCDSAVGENPVNPVNPCDEKKVTRIKGINGILGKRIFDGDKVISATNINAYLLDADNVFVESRTRALCDVPQMVYGNKPTDGGFLFLTPEEYEEAITREPQIKPLIRRILGSEEFINNRERYCLWLAGANPKDIRQSAFVSERVKGVFDFRSKSTKAATRKDAETPTLFQEIRQPDTEYIIVPSVSSENRKYIPIGFVQPEIIVNNAVLIIPNATLYHFGVLTSSVHMAWMRAVCGRLEMRYRYSKDIVYNNFPWPKDSEKCVVGSEECEVGREKWVVGSEKCVVNRELSPNHYSLTTNHSPLPTNHYSLITRTAQSILDTRARYPDASLADLYDELTMPPDLRKAHQANDRAVLDAYGLPHDIDEPSIVAHLMKLYQSLLAEVLKK